MSVCASPDLIKRFYVLSPVYCALVIVDIRRRVSSACVVVSVERCEIAIARGATSGKTTITDLVIEIYTRTNIATPRSIELARTTSKPIHLLSIYLSILIHLSVYISI